MLHKSRNGLLNINSKAFPNIWGPEEKSLPDQLLFLSVSHTIPQDPVLATDWFPLHHP